MENTKILIKFEDEKRYMRELQEKELYSQDKRMKNDYSDLNSHIEGLHSEYEAHVKACARAKTDGQVEM